jgi:ATP-dependent phosphofructokinase / diphosphate-dependent phosphofructokinase
MKIGILTGGGDVPGLNPCIKALVNRATDEGYEVIGFRRGWAGPLNYNLEEDHENWRYAIRLDKQAVRTVDRTGGTFLHTSRTNPSKVTAKEVPDFLREADFDENSKEKKDYTAHILKVLERLKVDVLVPIGGDDTLSYAHRLHTEGFPTIAIPKTMDNDVYGTDYCIGFSTAISRAVGFIHNLRTSAGSHERIAIVELFGRNSGETSLISAYLSGVDRALISEVPYDPTKLAKLIMEDKHNNPSNYAMLTISEGATVLGGSIVEVGDEDAYGHKKLGGIGNYTAEVLKKLTGHGIIYQQIAYLMRSGAPDSLDLMIGLNYANMAMDLISEGKRGRMVALRDGSYTNVPLDIVSQGVKRVDIDELYDVDQYRPKVRHVDGKPMFLY